VLADNCRIYTGGDVRSQIESDNFLILTQTHTPTHIDAVQTLWPFSRSLHFIDGVQFPQESHFYLLKMGGYFHILMAEDEMTTKKKLHGNGECVILYSNLFLNIFRDLISWKYIFIFNA
jgi:hypothetical protein